MFKKFHYFPYKKDAPYILYDDSKVFSSEVFLSLYNKLYGVNSWKLILRKTNPVSIIFEQINKTRIIVPEDNVNLIYVGYDSSLYFCLDSNMQVSRLYRNLNGEFFEEEYLGPSLSIYNSHSLEHQMPYLKNFFQDWWDGLKKGKHAIHGDLTPFNICISEGKISLVDFKPHRNDSIIFDHLYFFAYSMHLLSRRKFMKSSEKHSIRRLLEELILASFPEDDFNMVIQLAKSLELKEEPPFDSFETYREHFIALVDGAR